MIGDIVHFRGTRGAPSSCRPAMIIREWVPGDNVQERHVGTVQLIVFPDGSNDYHAPAVQTTRKRYLTAEPRWIYADKKDDARLAEIAAELKAEKVQFVAEITEPVPEEQRLEQRISGMLETRVQWHTSVQHRSKAPCTPSVEYGTESRYAYHYPSECFGYSEPVMEVLQEVEPAGKITAED